VFTGPEGGLLNGNALRDRCPGIPPSPRRAWAAARCTRPSIRLPRMPWPRGSL